MGYYLGRAIQLVAMLQVLYALYMGFVVQDWKSELKLLAFGAGLFLLGRLVERRHARA